MGQLRPWQAAEHAGTRAGKVPVTHAARKQDAPSTTPLSVARGFLSGLKGSSSPWAIRPYFCSSREDAAATQKGKPQSRSSRPATTSCADNSIASGIGSNYVARFAAAYDNAIGGNNKQGMQGLAAALAQAAGHIQDMRRHQRDVKGTILAM